MSWQRIKPPQVCICEHSDWCMVSNNGDAFLCMRVPSDRPVNMSDGSVGYIHQVGEPIHDYKKYKKELRPEINWEAILIGMHKATDQRLIENLSVELGVSYSSLIDLETVWSVKHNAWAFPMRNGYGKVSGFRIRCIDGSKKSIYGSKNALFIPHNIKDKDRLFLFEGPSDTAAAITIGLNAFGRPSCSAGLFDIVTLVERLHTRELVIVSDNDNPGMDGAETLSHHLRVRHCIITVPNKDMREYLKRGGRSKGLNAIVRSTVWRQPALGLDRS